MAYRDEQTLVRQFLRHFKKMTGRWAAARIVKEFYYQNGRTDVVAISRDGEVLAFEAKLNRWRDALHQAYRNTCFAHRSYVILPQETASVAGRFISEFDRRRVGLCAVTGKGIVFLNDPPRTDPVQGWLAKRAATAGGR